MNKAAMGAEAIVAGHAEAIDETRRKLAEAAYLHKVADGHAHMNSSRLHKIADLLEELILTVALMESEVAE